MQSKKLYKFFLTAGIYILTLYVYSILRGTKDALIVGDLGAGILSAFKLYGVLPSAVILLLVYVKLADYFTRLQLYHFFIWFFVSFFILFDLVLYPQAQLIHFDFNALALKYPFFKYILTIISYCSYSLFYIMSELWKSMMLALMFWQLANQINSIDEARRYYPLYGFFAQVGLVVSGLLMMVFTNPSLASDWKSSLHYICFSIFISGALLSAIIFILSNYIVSKGVINGVSLTSSKSKPGLIKSLKSIFTSKYLDLITLLILCYGTSINLVEGVWKKEISFLYPDPKDYGYFTGIVHVLIGIATFFAMLASAYILRIFSWKVAAITTPIVIFLTGCPFFLFVTSETWFTNYLSITTAQILFIAVVFGAAQNVLSKVIKYAFFDPTKEMAYIPLDEELKSKGKAAADVVGGRLGKSGGAFIQQAMLSFVAGSTLVSLAPNLFVIFVIITGIWFLAVFALDKEFKLKTDQGRKNI